MALMASSDLTTVSKSPPDLCSPMTDLFLIPSDGPGHLYRQEALTRSALMDFSDEQEISCRRHKGKWNPNLQH
jgi:hypothetical protein